MRSIAMRGVRNGRRGSAIVTVMVLLAVLLVLLAAFVRLVGAASSEQTQSSDHMQVMYVAEAGLGEAYLALENELPPERGAPDAPLELGNVSYFVEVADLGTRVYALRSTAEERATRERLELVVREIPDGFFRYAVFGEEGVTFDTSSFVDSYDSALGIYDDQYDTSTGHAGDFGNVGSNADITLQTNTEIWGNANPGPDGEIVESGQNIFVSGSTDSADELVVLPPIQTPAIASSGDRSVQGTTLVLGPGDVHLRNVNVSSGGKIQIWGPARFVVDDLVMAANTTLEIIASGGPVEIYGTGDFEMRSNSHLVTHTSEPIDAAFYLSGNNIDGSPRARIEFNSNSDFVGVIYAPNAAMSIQAMFNVYGSVMARRVDLGSNSAIHYDVNLLFNDDNGPPVFQQLSWRPIGFDL
jgi:hypothetical protein